MTHLLVVDDNADVAEAVSIALTEAGYATTAARTLSDARERINSTEIDGVIVDVWMDTDNGLEFAAEIAKHTPPTPFIVMSGGGPGKSLEAVTARADSLGAAAVLFKPFEDDELLNAVRAMLAS
ncbi:MAG: response regulator [Pseudomonadota bacterium]